MRSLPGLRNPVLFGWCPNEPGQVRNEAALSFHAGAFRVAGWRKGEGHLALVISLISRCASHFIFKDAKMTQKLFWQDPYQAECKAKITFIDGKKVKVDQTVFFAFSGGQESDSGTIGGINVLNALKEGEKENIIDIEYELESEPAFKVGDEVDIKIDHEKRSNLRRLHSGAHIAYYFIVERFGKMKIIGSNIASEKARVDFETDTNLSEGLQDVEDKLNSYLAQGHEILRSKDEKHPDLLWWECSLGKMPCGGTHAKNTSEIGRLKLKRVTKGKGKERVEIYLA